MDLTYDPECFRPQLQRLQQEMLELGQTADAGADTVELDQTRVGRLSRMDALQSQAMSVETRRRRQWQLKQIAAALRRLDNGNYGYCLECGEPITRGRLEIDPAATLCIVCAEAAEH